MTKVSFNDVKIIMAFAVLVTSVFSCKKMINIPSNPPSEITQAQEFADSSTAMTAVAGVYTYGVINQGFAYSDGLFTKGPGCSADELSVTNTGDFREFYSYGIKPTNSTAESLWSVPYQAIYSINAILEGVEASPGLSASFKRLATGEMKVVRAFYYFNLVNLFGAVPLVTSTDYRQTAHIPRTSVDEVYKQIIADLTDAIKNLPASYPSEGRVRPNFYMAQSLLAKVHLYQGKWQDAFNEADSVIQSNVYGLEPDLNNVFLDGSNEAIWQLPILSSFQVTTEEYDFVPYSDGITPNYLLTPFLLNAFEPDDRRLQKWVGSTVVKVGDVDQKLYYPYKYKNKYPTDSPVEDYMIFRLGEVYLIRAEAAAHLNTADKLNQALADINTIRQRAGLLPSTAKVTSQIAVLNAVIKERQTELFTEWGNRWFDLKRNVTPETSAATILGTEKKGFNVNAELYPIPQAQIQLDDLLKQNPGY